MVDERTQFPTTSRVTTMEATNDNQFAAPNSASSRGNLRTRKVLQKGTRSEDASVYSETEGPHDVSEHEIELHPMVGNAGTTSNQRKPQRSKRRVVWQMGVFYLLGKQVFPATRLIARRTLPRVTHNLTALGFMSVHLGFFLALDGQTVKLSRISQSLQSALANFLAIAVEICLLSGISVAYDQYLWRLFRRKSLRAVTIDKLIRLVSSPWNLVLADIVSGAPGPWLIALICLIIPVAVVFPPGALTVEFLEGVLPVGLNNVPTINLSDWGNGTVPDFSQHAFFQTGPELEFRVVRLRSKFLKAPSALCSHVMETNKTACRVSNPNWPQLQIWSWRLANPSSFETPATAPVFIRL